MKKRPAPSRKRASSLVVTLLVITILTVIVIAFLQSMSIERKTALSYSNVAKARLAAEAGSEEAMSTVRSLFLSYPDSATAWVTNMAPPASSNQTPGTAFYYYDTVSVTNTSATPANLFFRPLVSGATNVALTNRATALAGVTNLTNWININSSNLMEGRAWVGRPPGSTNDPRIDLPWVDILDGTNIVARYAYWVEDESFRVNLNVATNVPRGSTSMGTNASEIPIQGALRPAITSDATRGTLATNIVQLRQTLPFGGDLKSLKNINYASAAYTNLSDTIGFITTIHSSGLNVSRTGARRVNLNAIVATNTSPASGTVIRGELDRIITTITNQAPQFGQRFYRTSASATNSPGVTAAHATIYLNKIAANIRDYIDSDSQPTVVMDDATVYADGAPLVPIGDIGSANNVWAIGKENVPRLQEGILHVSQYGSMSTTSGSTSSWNIRLAYYFEFWNQGTKDITLADLGPNAFIRVMDQAAWVDAGANAGNGGVARPIPGPPGNHSRDFNLPLSSFVDGSGNALRFPAGEVTVITTEPDPQNVTLLATTTAIANKMFRPAASLNSFPHVYGNPYGATNLASVTSPNNLSGYQSLATLFMDTQPGSASHPTQNPGSDYQTKMILGNDHGYLESHLSPIAVNIGIYVDAFNSNTKSDRTRFHIRGGSLVGNLTPARGGSAGGTFQVGDPRANNEQLSFTDMSTSAAYQTRFAQERQGSSGGTPYQSASSATDYSTSLGLQNTSYANPNSSPVWDEGNNARTVLNITNGGSPAYYQDGLMQSIGELGHVYDPARGTITANLNYASGGGRTLRIGQSEAILGVGSGFAFWDGNPSSASRRWTAWRLLDFFSTRDETNSSRMSSTLGPINPNGALRDSGAAILAAFEGFAFSSSNQFTDSTLSSKSLSPNDAAIFASHLTNYLANSNNVPFFERGQLSELGFFNTNSLPGLSGVTMTSLNDRGREELFRRMAEMITTKGNTFTIYVVGQTLSTLPNGQQKPVATSMRKVTFRLIPQYASANLSFDPSAAASIISRFASPTNYVIQVINQSEN